MGLQKFASAPEADDITICCSSCDAGLLAQTKAEIFRYTAGPVTVCIFVALLVAWLVYRIRKTVERKTVSGQATHHRDPWPLIYSAMILGIGIGGMIDGIVLHETLQWHSMVSAKVPPFSLENKNINMFWDGIFHAFTLTIVIIGISNLYKISGSDTVAHSSRLLIGGGLMGWGLFNIVEGIIDHHILNLHNVRDLSANPTFWNVTFLVISVLIFIAGLFLCMRTRTQLAAKSL